LPDRASSGEPHDARSGSRRAARRPCHGHARSFVSAHINACVLMMMMMMTEKAADLIQAAARAPVAATDRY
jgi:hypothetical protein